MEEKPLIVDTSDTYKIMLSEHFTLKKIIGLSLVNANVIYLTSNLHYFSAELNQVFKFQKDYYGHIFIDEWDRVQTLDEEIIKKLALTQDFTPIWKKYYMKNIRAFIHSDLFVEVKYHCIVDHHRGEDSGAIYPDYGDELICRYDFSNYSGQDISRLKEVAGDGVDDFVNGFSEQYDIILEHPELCVYGTPTHRPRIKY